jgi:hypothetical protein
VYPITNDHHLYGRLKLRIARHAPSLSKSTCFFARSNRLPSFSRALTRFERLGLADIIYQKSVRGLAGSAVSASGGIPHPRRPPFDQKRAFFFHHGILSPLKLEKGKALAIH